MATAPYDGVAYLDLEGNRVVWSPSDNNRDHVLLNGSHFHDIIPMVTLVISILCLLSFIAILLTVCCGRRHAAKYLPWATVWVPLFCMIGFFGTDIANRILHELQKTVHSEYLGIDIAIGCFASIADGLLMVYLTRKSPVEIKHGGILSKMAMVFAIAVYWIIGVASKGTQIWNLIIEILPPDDSNDSSNSNDGTDEGVDTSMQIYQDLGSAASGMLLLFAIGYALFAMTFLRRRSMPLHTSDKRLSFAVAMLATSFLVRNAVRFAFTLLYSQFNHVASPSLQLVYMVFYGILSVAIYASIVLIASFQKSEPSNPETRYDQVQQTAVNDEVDWQQQQHQHQQEKPSPFVRTDEYPSPGGYHPYGYENLNPQRW